MAMFTDTVTVYHKVDEGIWEISVIKGVQWSDKIDRKNENGRISIVKYAEITFPEGTYDGLILDPASGEDCIVLGECRERISDEKGNRLSDLIKMYSDSGIVQSVNDNSKRSFLKNIKVVVV